MPCYRRDTCTYIEFINAIICAVSCCNVKNERLYIAIQKHCNGKNIAMRRNCNAGTLQHKHNKIAGTLQRRNIATQKHCNAETLQRNKWCNTKDKYCNTMSPQLVQQYIMVITAFHCNKSTGMALPIQPDHALHRVRCPMYHAPH